MTTTPTRKMTMQTDISTRAFAGLAALAMASTAAVIGLSTPTVAHAGDPRPCVAQYTVTKTDGAAPLAGATFDVTAPAGSLIVPADEYIAAFVEWNEKPGTAAFEERTAPLRTAINALRQVPLAPQQNWDQWYGATPEQEAMYIGSWVDDTSTQATYRDILSERIEKANALPDGLGAGVVADSEAALAQLDVTLNTSDYATWVTAHKAVYAVVSTAPVVDYAPEMTAAEKAMDADHRAAVVARYDATETYTSDAAGQFAFAVWNPAVLTGPDCSAASISPVLTETKAPEGFALLDAPVQLAPKSTEDDTAYENTATIVNQPVKPEPTPEPTPEPEPEPEPTPELEPVKPTPTPTPEPVKPGLPSTGN